MVACGVFTLALSTAGEAFQLLLSVGAGTGLIYLLRWFWWRINAWSEISAMISSFVISLGFFVARKSGVAFPDYVALISTVAATTVVWVTVTLLTKPADAATLRRFYELTRPAGPGWNAVRRETDLPPSSDSFPQMLLGWTAGVTFVYAGLFGTGSVIYGRTTAAAIWIALFVVSGVVLIRAARRQRIVVHRGSTASQEGGHSRGGVGHPHASRRRVDGARAGAGSGCRGGRQGDDPRRSAVSRLRARVTRRRRVHRGVHRRESARRGGASAICVRHRAFPFADRVRRASGADRDGGRLASR
jgi:hypothetical protein